MSLSVSLSMRVPITDMTVDFRHKTIKNSLKVPLQSSSLRKVVVCVKSG